MGRIAFKDGRQRKRRLGIAWATLAVVAVVWPAAAGAATLPGLPAWTGTVQWWKRVPWAAQLPGAPQQPGTPSAPGIPQQPPAGGGTAGTPFSGTYSGVAGSRNFRALVPSSYTKGTAMPMVVVLHGCTENADVMRQLTRFDQLAEAKGFIAVFPEQPQSANPLECWNFFQDAHMHRGSGEPALIAGITGWMQKRYTVDPRRIYVTGLSAGGGMASVMGATYPDLYAAIATGSGCEYASTATCAGSQSADPNQAGAAAYKEMGSRARAMPVIAFQGDQNTTVPPVNADQLIQQWQQTADLAQDGSVPGAPARTTSGQVPNGRSYTVSYYNDANGAELAQKWIVHGMTHAWSGGCSCESYADPQGPDATAAMYAFFMSHPMP